MQLEQPASISRGLSLGLGRGFCSPEANILQTLRTTVRHPTVTFNHLHLLSTRRGITNRKHAQNWKRGTYFPYASKTMQGMIAISLRMRCRVYSLLVFPGIFFPANEGGSAGQSRRLAQLTHYSPVNCLHTQSHAHVE